jgi:hypothetical protein
MAALLKLSTLLVALVLALAPSACGGDEEAAPPGEAAGAPEDPVHVHGLGINPTDEALYIATHTGLWRAREGETRARRVGDLRHDLMGFTVAGPDEFLASGHPDNREDLPPLLGLQRSTDAGRTWQAVSLLGDADLHVLRVAGARIYGVDAATGGILTSIDGGRSWEERTPPAAVFDLVAHPQDPERVVAATEEGLFSSSDTGRRWRPVQSDVAGLLAWPAADALYLVDATGTVSRSRDGGGSFTAAGSTGGPPEALLATDVEELYAAVHGGGVVASSDGGASWRTRAAP